MRSLLPILLVLMSAPAMAQTLKGIETADINTAVQPCQDFYEYANGAWRASHPIPASMPRWSRRWAAGELAKDQLHAILDDIVAQPAHAKGSVEQLIGDHYAACMNEPLRDQRGLDPLKPLLSQIDAIASAADLQAAMRRLHGIGVTVPFSLSGSSDPHNPSQTIADISASGLGMPDRDYYFKDEARFKEAREKYRAYVAKMFELAGRSDTQAAAASTTVMNFETALAGASLDNVALRDPSATDHKVTFAALQQMAPHIDWATYFAAGKLPTIPLNVSEPKFIQAVDRAVTTTPLTAWKTYLTWQLLNSAANDLSLPFQTESFNFYGKYLAGSEEINPLWKRCVQSTDSLLGEALGQKYVEKHFPPEAKARMQDLVHNVLLAMHDVIENLSWMGPQTKQKALEKLATFTPKVGYPDKWKDYSSVVIRPDAFWEDVMAASAFGVDDDRSTIGKPVDKARWGMTPPTSDAYYNPLQNEIVFPAGILQPPAFSLDVVDAVNYGAIGVVIGHEVSHGFDDEGAQFDAEGRLQNWWTPDDLKQFEARTACVVNQFDHYDVQPGIHHNGKLVLGEAIGDLAGARVAYLAFQKAQAAHPAPTIDGFTPDQQFFIAWGQFRGDAIRPETERLMVQSDPHPIAKFRVIGPLSNLPAFQKAFSCPAGAPMVRPPDNQMRGLVGHGEQRAAGCWQQDGESTKRLPAATCQTAYCLRPAACYTT